MRYIFIILLLTILTTHLPAQDANFSQYYSAPLYLNPALTGLEPNPHFALNYRGQWKNFNYPYFIGQASFIHPIYVKVNNYLEHKGGVGVSVFNELSGNNGAFANYGANFTLSYNLILDQTGSQMVSFGVQSGYIENRININELTWGSQYDPFIGFDPSIAPSVDLFTDRVSYTSFNAGIMYYYKSKKRLYNNSISGFAGFATNYLNRPDHSFYQSTEPVRMPMLFKFHGGLELKSSDNTMSISPNVLIQHQKDLTQYDIGSYFTYEILDNMGRQSKSYSLLIGTWFRLQDSFILSAGFQAPNYTVGFSFDSNVSTLRYNSRGGGAFEISLNYILAKEKKVRKFSTPLI